MAPGLDLADDGRTFGKKQLHADLDKGFFTREMIQKFQRTLAAGKIQRDDDVFTHDVLLL